MAAPSPAEQHGQAAENRPSFFAALLARARSPYVFPPVPLPVIDPAGEHYERTVELVVEVPDDHQVAALDDCGNELDELEVLAGDDLDDLLDVCDELGRDPEDVADDLLEHFGLLDSPDIGWHGLVERINVYGRGLQYDLWERGHRLSDYFRGDEPDGWDHLLEVAARLPGGSHYKAAIADDDELARQVAEEYGPPSKRQKQTRPPLEGWSTEVAYLHRITNALQFLGWAVFAAQAGKKRGNPPKGAKGPETADDRYEWADYMREHDDVVSRVLVRKGGTPKPPTAPGRAPSSPGSFGQRESGLWAPQPPSATARRTPGASSTD